MSTAPRVIVLGAASAIAEACARLWASRGAHLLLVARDPDRLHSIAGDLRARGAGSVSVQAMDCAGAHAARELPSLVAQLGGLDVLLLAYGVLGTQHASETDNDLLAEVIQTNYASAVAWCVATGRILERQRSGCLVVMGSVAGDRGRRSNFIYGSTKAGLAHLVEGLAHKLEPLGARAVVVKPGWVDTPMTAGMAKGGPLWASPAQVARVIVRAADGGAVATYAPGFWRLIMYVIRNLPRRVFNRLNV